MTTTSIGVQELRKRIGAKAKADPRHRFSGLYTHVWKLDVLREAYRLAKNSHGARGARNGAVGAAEPDGAPRSTVTGGCTPATGLSGAVRPAAGSHKPSFRVGWQRRMEEISMSGATGGGRVYGSWFGLRHR